MGLLPEAVHLVTIASLRLARVVRQEPSARRHNRKGGDHGQRAGPASPQRPLHRTGWPLSQRKNDTSRSHTGAHRRHHPPGSMADGNTVGDASGEARHHGMSVELNVATVDFLGDSFHLPRLPRLDRVPGRRGERAHGLRRRGGGVRAGREEGAGAATHPQAARRSRHSAFPLHQQDRQGRGAGTRHRADAAAGERPSRWCCARSPSGRTTSSPASSISRWSALTSIASMRRARSMAHSRCARRA